MSFETGTSTGMHDILAKVRAFALADSWTVNRYDTSSSTKHELCVSKADMYYNMASFENHDGAPINGNTGNDVYALFLNGSDGYSAGADWDRQPGYPQHTTTSVTDQRHVQIFGQGSFPSYMASSPNADCIYFEVEISPTVYQRFGFGKLVDENDVSGGFGDNSAMGDGRFFFATTGANASPPTGIHNDNDTEDSRYSMENVPFRSASYSTNSNGYYNNAGSFVRVNSDGFNGWAQSARSASTTTASATGGAASGCSGSILWSAGNSPLSGQGLTVPIVVGFNVGGQFLKPIGIVPGFRITDISLYEPGEEFSLGSDVWRAYPWWQKAGKSGQRGLCYLRVD